MKILNSKLDKIKVNFLSKFPHGRAITSESILNISKTQTKIRKLIKKI